jgi:hypothetical protein
MTIMKSKDACELTAQQLVDLQTVLNNQQGCSSAECLQALCKHFPSELCRRVPNQLIGPELYRLVEPFHRHHTAHVDHVARLCKPEVTGSIPVRSTAYN